MQPTKHPGGIPIRGGSSGGGGAADVGLDHYQVRRYDAWCRHITLVLCAHAYLAVTAAHAQPHPSMVTSGDADTNTAPKQPTTSEDTDSTRRC
ncbi:hypothetical protein E1166_02010 [Micromonospora sp. KC213]|nr:hypothetical protein E1166_02010 [Micromonospora sp. KC213]